jgi:hypothetical protein
VLFESGSVFLLTSISLVVANHPSINFLSLVQPEKGPNLLIPKRWLLFGFLNKKEQWKVKSQRFIYSNTFSGLSFQVF